MMNREKAIDIIKAERACVERQGRTGECCRDDLGCGACDLVMEDVDIIEAYEMAIVALKERPHGEWIPVSERLPEEKINPNTRDFEEVLCTTTWGDVRPYKFGKPIGHDKAHFWHGYGIMDKEVIAWMPLPEPYKKEGEAE